MDKPKKPRKDFPLYPHPSGQWAKTINWKKVYFGPWDDPMGAEKRYQSYLATGDQRAPIEPHEDLTVLELCDEFIDTKKRLAAAGELSERQLADLVSACEMVLASMGRRALVDSITPRSFAGLHEDLRRRFQSPAGRRSRIANVRSIFNFAISYGLTSRPIPFGDFRAPSQKAMRRHAEESRRTHGLKIFTWMEILLLLNAATPIMRALILLGINCGLNPADIKGLSRGDIKGQWLEYYRRKAATQRRACLWPETTKAIDEASDVDARSGPIFVTRHGNPWGERSGTVTREFRKLLDATWLYRRGHSFGTLRSTYRTWADEVKDQPAVNLTMGHVDSHISADYRQEISDKRLIAVADHVRSRLFNQSAD